MNEFSINQSQNISENNFFLQKCASILANMLRCSWCLTTFKYILDNARANQNSSRTYLLILRILFEDSFEFPSLEMTQREREKITSCLKNEVISVANVCLQLLNINNNFGNVQEALRTPSVVMRCVPDFSIPNEVTSILLKKQNNQTMYYNL